VVDVPHDRDDRRAGPLAAYFINGAAFFDSSMP